MKYSKFKKLGFLLLLVGNCLSFSSILFSHDHIKYSTAGLCVVFLGSYFVLAHESSIVKNTIRREKMILKISIIDTIREIEMLNLNEEQKSKTTYYLKKLAEQQHIEIIDIDKFIATTTENNEQKTNKENS